MGPYSEEMQMKRADAIQRLLDQNPQIDKIYRGMWERKLRSLARDETSYNIRVKQIYGSMTKNPLVDWGGGK